MSSSSSSLTLLHQHKDRSLAYALTTSSLALSASLLLFLYQRRSTTTTNTTAITNNKKDRGGDRDTTRKLPPKAPTTLFETLNNYAGLDQPWFLIDTARKLNSQIYRLENFEYLVGGKMVVVVGDAPTALKILTDPLSTKPENIYRTFDALTKGYRTMFSSNGQLWHSRRKGMAPAFSSKHVKRMNAVAAERVDDWINTKLSNYIDNNQSFDVAKEMISITLSAITETAFDYKMTEEEMTEYVHELELACLEFFLKAGANPLRPITALFSKERRRAFLAAERIAALSERIVQSYHDLENPTKDTIIDRIMTNKAYKNDKERVADVSFLLIGGHDTTAYSISWILKELAKSPSIQQDLRESLKNFSSDEYDKSPVLRNVVREGMRLHPVASGGSGRVLGKDIETPQGYLLPKGSVIFMPYILQHRDQNVFDDADSFIPSRWENPTTEMNDSFMPFAAGKQNCIGQSLARAEILNIVPRICAEYELELAEEGTVEYFLTLKPRNTMLKARKLN